MYLELGSHDWHLVVVDGSHFGIGHLRGGEHFVFCFDYVSPRVSECDSFGSVLATTFLLTGQLLAMLVRGACQCRFFCVVDNVAICGLP